MSAAETAERLVGAACAVPAGRVVAYGDLGRLAGIGPRQAGRLVGELSESLPWWRVVHADGRPGTCHEGRAEVLLRAEGVAFRGARVDLARCRWVAPAVDVD